MSAKFVYNLSEDNPELQKQIGCMNGIFQLFGRHHFVGGGRRYIGQRHKCLTSGQNGNHGVESKHASQNTTEKDDKTTSRERHRTSTESSRTSLSSSPCSSSLSSLESAKATQQETSSFSQTVTQESRQRDSPVYCSNASSLSTWQSPDLRHTVMNSLFRETRGISIKTATKGEVGGQILKYIDSPRPLQCPKSVEPNYSGLRESIRVSQKSQQPPRKSSERAQTSFSSSLKDVRRLSLDGREPRDSFKSTMKLKELPRLSLDSQAGSTRRYKNEGAISHPLQDAKSGNFNDFVSRQGPGTSRQSSSVIAKLMGLEALTETTSNDGDQTGQFKGYYDMESDTMQSSRTTNQDRQNQNASSPRCISKEPSSPKPKGTDSVKKNASKTKSSTESVPWSHSLGKSKSPPSALLGEATIRKDQSSYVSVFGEMEKRLAQLEFKKSGKDLRALKQILEAMQKTRETFENRSDASEFVSHTGGNKSLDLSSDLENLITPRSSTTKSFSMKEYSSSEIFKSHVFISKPAKLTRKVKPASQINHNDDLGHGQLETADSEVARNKSNDKQIARDLTRKTNDLCMSTGHPPLTQDKSPPATPARLTSTSNELQSTIRERTESTKNLRTTNSRHQQKRPELEKHSQKLTPSVDLNRVTRQTCRQSKQLGSHQRQPKSKASNLQMKEKEPNNTNGVRDSTNPVDTIFQQSESNVGKASLVDANNKSTDRSEKIQPTHLRQKVTRSIKDTTMADPIVAPSEQPSPVSVLDATFFDDELPSPIKKISTSIKDDEMFSDELDWNSIATNYSSSSINSSSVVDSINCLNQQLEQMLSVNESTTNELEDFNSNYTATKLNSTAHSIKSDLFLAMQQARGRKGRSDQGSDKTSSQQKLAKTQWKLLYDVLNEVLCQKLLLESSSKMWHAPIALADKVPRGLKLWEELCAEVDRLKSIYSTCSLDTDDDNLTGILREDLMQQTPHWRSNSEIPLLVLDVERMIFKDIINEVVIGEAMSLQRQSATPYRQLFSM